VHDLSFAYRSENVLEDLSIEIGKGQIVGLVGPNGSGKTTLIKCIDHILRPKGSILIDGREIGSMNITEVARHIGYVPQSSPPAPSSTVFDVVLMGRRCHMGWRVTGRDVECVTAILRRLGVEDMALRDFNTLSGGQKQKILIARALCQEPCVLLLDEPTSNLDMKHQLEALEYIRDLVGQTEISVIMSVHDLNLAARYADTLVMLKEGRIVAAGPPASLITTELIRDVYGVEARIIAGDGEGPIVVPLRAADAEQCVKRPPVHEEHLKQKEGVHV
jgi:iron complex transport system ATP-binding protein